jgi:ectoine hydroxylase-related dioxygenase (phytanoyl-CoA dioxygenase family)
MIPFELPISSHDPHSISPIAMTKQPIFQQLPEPSSKQRFERQGVIIADQLLPQDEIDRLRDTFTSQVESDNSMGHNDNLPDDDVLHRYPRFVHPHRHPDTAFGKLALSYLTDGRIIKIAEELIGPVHGAQTMFYFKPPKARGQAMHQDNFFLKSHPETCLAVWIAIDDADGENGGLVVIPGSHKNEILCHDRAAPADSFSSKEIRLPADATRYQTELKAGDALYFHGALVHGSKPNTSDRFRRALILHFIPQSSTEVAWFYQPLIGRDGQEVRITESELGGPCGEGWRSED